MEIFHHEQVIGSVADLADGRQLAVGEYVLVHPGVRLRPTLVLADGMQEEQPPVLQAAVSNLHIASVILVTHVLEHANTGNGIELPLHIPVILQTEFQWQVRVSGSGKGRLFLRDGHTHALHPIVLGRVGHETTPATADIQHPHTWFKLKFAADQIQLGFLGLRQGGGLFPVAAGIRHPGIQHGLIELIAQVVVLLAHLPGPTDGLAVENTTLQGL